MDQLKQQLITFSAFKSDSNISSLVWSIIMLTVVEQIISFMPQIKEMIKEFANRTFKKAKDKIELQANAIIQQKVASINFTRIYPKNDPNNGSQNYNVISDFDLADSIIDFCARLPQAKSIDYGKFFYVNHREEIHVDQEVYVRFLKFIRATTGELQEINFEVWSYSLSLDRLTKWCNKVLNDYRTLRQNKLGDQIYYFNEIFKPIPLDRDNNPMYKQASSYLSFTMNKFFTTKNLKNIYGEAVDLVKKRVDFFINNKTWYEKKGIPYSFGLLTYGVPGAGKTSLIKCLSNETKRHIFNISLSEFSTKTQLNNLFYSDTIVVETENRTQERLVIPQDKRLYIIEDIDCMTDIVLSRDFLNDSAGCEELETIDDLITVIETKEKVENDENEEKNILTTASSDITFTFTDEELEQKFAELLNKVESKALLRKNLSYYILLKDCETFIDTKIYRYILKDIRNCFDEIFPNKATHKSILLYYTKLWIQKTFNITYEKFQYYIQLKLNHFKNKYHKKDSDILLLTEISMVLKPLIFANEYDDEDEQYEFTGETQDKIKEEQDKILEELYTKKQFKNYFRNDFEIMLALDLIKTPLKNIDFDKSELESFINNKDNCYIYYPEKDEVKFEYKKTYDSDYLFQETDDDKFNTEHASMRIEILNFIEKNNLDEVKKMVEFGRVSEDEVKSIEESLKNKKAINKTPTDEKIKAADNKIQSKIEAKKQELSEEKLTLGYLLNLLDGVLEIPGRMIILTTNYPERLDKALIRPGRIDLHVEFTKASCKTIREMVRDFYDLKESEVVKYNFIAGKWTPAEIHQILFKNFDSPENAISQLCGN